MPYFVNITSKNFEQYFSHIAFLFFRYKSFLVDDFCESSNSVYHDIKKFVLSKTPFFWVIKDKTTYKFAGFVFLDNFVGSEKYLYSAELTTCFEKQFWGNFTKKTAKKFIRFCFTSLDFEKIKVQIYPENGFVKNILAHFGFKKEGILSAETKRNGKPQDIEVYGLLKKDYLKG